MTRVQCRIVIYFLLLGLLTFIPNASGEEGVLVVSRVVPDAPDILASLEMSNFVKGEGDLGDFAVFQTHVSGDAASAKWYWTIRFHEKPGFAFGEIPTETIPVRELSVLSAHYSGDSFRVRFAKNVNSKSLGIFLFSHDCLNGPGDQKDFGEFRQIAEYRFLPPREF